MARWGMHSPVFALKGKKSDKAADQFLAKDRPRVDHLISSHQDPPVVAGRWRATDQEFMIRRLNASLHIVQTNGRYASTLEFGQI